MFSGNGRSDRPERHSWGWAMIGEPSGLLGSVWRRLTSPPTTSTASGCPGGQSGFGGVVARVRVRGADTECVIYGSWWLLLGGVCAVSIALGAALSEVGIVVAALAAFAVAAALFLTTLAHEIGHALCGAWSGLRPTRIALAWYGGMVAFQTSAVTPRQQALSASGGPAANALFALGVGGLALLLDETPARLICLTVAAISAVYAVTNLVPVLPQDGGLIVEAAIWWRTGDPSRARRLTVASGLWLTIAITLCGVVLLVSGDGTLAALVLVQGTVTLTASLQTRRARLASPAA